MEAFSPHMRVFAVGSGRARKHLRGGPLGPPLPPRPVYFLGGAGRSPAVRGRPARLLRGLRQQRLQRRGRAQR